MQGEFRYGGEGEEKVLKKVRKKERELRKV